MGLLPTYCDACQRSRLVDESAFQSGAVTCRDCGSPARSVPGSSYAESDALLYDQLATALREAGISVSNAAQLLARLDSTTEQPGGALLKLVSCLPTLSALETIAHGEPEHARRAEGMLSTILEAIASQRRRSGLLPAILGVSPVKQRHSSKRRS